ncbi:MAG: lysophospholipid acyltransferase family protein [Yoonia sp.]|uniref:lysophospholipid acyltransferase family protein n=1 Tax=Yoonia sp. TaxID=2212373 RepID=UPI003EF9C689
MTLRKRIENSEFLINLVGRTIGYYLSFCTATTKWQYEGMDDLKAALAEGPVLVMTWHSRSAMGSMHWPSDVAPLAALHNTSPIGRVTGAMQQSSGLQPIKMAHNASNIAASRAILKSVKAGMSMALTGDGPKGPARELKEAPLEWARVTGIPIFCYAFSTTRGWRVKSWDRMLLPRSFGKGACVFRRIDRTVPRKLDEAARAELRAEVSRWMDETTARADAMVSLPPGP